VQPQSGRGWDDHGELVENPDVEVLESRDADPIKKAFQVGANTSERKSMKVGKRGDLLSSNCL
jgi:hypothetical protein